MARPWHSHAALCLQSLLALLPVFGYWPYDLTRETARATAVAAFALVVAVPCTHLLAFGSPARSVGIVMTNTAAGLVLGFPMFYTAAVLLGAPLWVAADNGKEYRNGTRGGPGFAAPFCWALMMAAATCAPTFARLGLPWAPKQPRRGGVSGSGTGGGQGGGSTRERWFRCTLDLRPVGQEERVICLSLVLAVVGAWAGGCVSPLDWEEAWQPWPVASCYGGLIGVAMAPPLSWAGAYMEWTIQRLAELERQHSPHARSWSDQLHKDAAAPAAAAARQ